MFLYIIPGPVSVPAIIIVAVIVAMAGDSTDVAVVAAA